MYIYKRYILLFTIFLGLYPNVWGQEIEIKRIELNGKDVILHYDLEDADIDRRYAIYVYLSIDNYTQPSHHVEGDIGVDIKPGANKKVIWHAGEELGNEFNDRVSIRLNGSIYTPFISLQGFTEGTVFKRGVKRQVIWSGGRNDNVLDFEILKGEKNTGVVFGNISNVVGSQAFTMPKSLKPGNDYKFRISDSNNREEMIYSPTFKVKRKIPLGYKVGAGLVIGAAAYILYNTLKTETIEDPPALPGR